MAILYVGIDLAKNVFAIHGVDEHGKAMLMRSRCNAPGCISWWPRCLRAPLAWRPARERIIGPGYLPSTATPCG